MQYNFAEVTHCCCIVSVLFVSILPQGDFLDSFKPERESRQPVHASNVILAKFGLLCGFTVGSYQMKDILPCITIKRCLLFHQTDMSLKFTKTVTSRQAQVEPFNKRTGWQHIVCTALAT